MIGHSHGEMVVHEVLKTTSLTSELASKIKCVYVFGCPIKVEKGVKNVNVEQFYNQDDVIALNPDVTKLDFKRIKGGDLLEPHYLSNYVANYKSLLNSK
jgi:hypothetical protein